MKKLVICLFGVLIMGCQSVPSAIPDDLTPREMFQLAQEAVVDRGDYKTALRYYETLLERYPAEQARVAEAEYEIAFINYKQKEYQIASEKLQALLAKYDQDTAGVLPAWPKVLAQRILSEIENITAAE